MSGLFITLEGIDGAGKSSHIDSLEALFRQEGRTVVRTREPGGTPLAELLRNLVLAQPMDVLTETLLVFAARRDHLVGVIEPALARGDVVICDRFTDATFAYQGAGRGLDRGWLETLEQWVQRTGPHGSALRQPDITLWFDLPAEQAAERLAGARAPDRFESEPVQFFRRVSQGYAERAAACARFVRIDANQSREGVWSAVVAALGARGAVAAGAGGGAT